MSVVRLRKIGTSNVLTVPSYITPKDTEFDVFSGRNGAIIYTPRTSNPFLDEHYVATHEGTIAEVAVEVDLDDNNTD
ncbi:antitoxin of toxin-antitoxin stability system [Weissella cibaria]|uniref:antitoxin of toxin-antitoxin stability system n=1 Tax=Weissella cibaria TaxID=137591 RepID=UPI001195D16F|nr:antitoxin of toxin-antitoxin stability system [Weissella cibaria]MCT0021448.1 antitoxin of toxin-antitoxin stability system [Weissella cibaria]TVV25654.1 antitoxin of toxin-antitoxin stability system [Weissella cibaria]